MAKCTDCLHYDVCLQLFKIAIGREPTANGNRAEKVCKNFKDRIRYAEVVRCKDCKYWESRLVNAKGFVICSASGMDITTEDFCSYGERREGE